MKTLYFKILGEPKPKQSFRYAIRKGREGQNFVAKYQPKEVEQATKNISWDVKSQLPQGFVPFDEPIGIKALFVFGIPKGFSKAKRSIIASGEVIYKDTKPDCDNLWKLVGDAMQGIVYIDDSRICSTQMTKQYGEVPRIEIEVYRLNAPTEEELASVCVDCGGKGYNLVPDGLSQYPKDCLTCNSTGKV